MPFLRTSSARPKYESPTALYRDLNRRPRAVPGLWAHQAEMLKTYKEAHTNHMDVALELPTGTGKTLTGLLIAEWTRHSRQARVIYACPTQQLARQVVAAAHREGIDTALLIDNWRTWPPESRAAYEAAENIAVTTYSSIFNSRTQLLDADLILFDDAHAGEQYIGENYGVKLSRWDHPDEYRAVLDTIAPALDGVYVDRLRNAQPDPAIENDVRLVVPLRQPGMVSALNTTLSGFAKPHKYRYSMIQAGLSSCLVYTGFSEILVRPYLPPTYQNQLFVGARQRIYLSATLGEGGELERAFGRPGITRLKQEEGGTAPRYGRRFFVFPEFAADVDPLELSRDIVTRAGKALVLAPRTDFAEATAAALAQPGWQQWGFKEVEQGMEAFAKLDHGVCGLAARYDGLDLPGDACRLVALDGLPDQDNLQERFLQARARAGASLATRLRTRVVQGAGRCTRGPEDTAIVLVLNARLSRYLTRPEVISALDSELQAELRFGRENSQKATAADILANVDAFLNQDTDDTWRDEAEPVLTDYRHEMPKLTPDATRALNQCVEQEILAWAAATARSWMTAAQHAHEVARLVGTGGSDTTGYRAFWMYLESVWTDQAAEDQSDDVVKASARRLVEQAEQAIGIGSWVREMAPFPAMQRADLSAQDALAVNQVAAQLSGGINQGKLRTRIQNMHDGLKQRKPGQYEPALTELGRLLGAEASKPPGRGRCDSTWCWGNDLWLAMEAKSDHDPTGVVPHKDIRQANDQLRLLSNDRGVPTTPLDSATVIISAKSGIDEDGIKSAGPDVYMVAPPLISEIAFDVGAAWESLLTRKANQTASELCEMVTTEFRSRGILPTQVHERLTREPVAARGA